MFDLSVKDKPRSPFGKLKDKMKGRQKYDLESASAIVPSSSGALDEDYDPGGKKAKARGFFFKNKLRKSSLTRSNTSLGSDSTVSSASIGTPEAMAQSPSRHSSLSTERAVRDFLPSPKLTHKRAFSDEVSQINTLPESRSVQSLKPQNEPISRSSLCINGSHIYCDEPAPKPAFLSSAPAPLPPIQSSSRPNQRLDAGPRAPEPDLPPWSSSSSSFQKGPPKDPPRFIPSPPILAAQEEDKLSVKTIALNKQRGRAKMAEGLRGESKPVQMAAPTVFSATVVRVRPQEEAQQEEEEERGLKTGFFRRGGSKEGGKSGVAGSEAEPSPSLAAKGKREAAAGGGGGGGGGREEAGGRSSSWFGLPDSRGPPRKPSSQSGLLATTEFATDTCFFEDCGPSPFVRVGGLQPESPPQRLSNPEPPAAPTRAPPGWDESFDAFATSRLRPEARREAPMPPPAAAVSEGAACPGSPGGSNPSESTAELLLQREGEPPGSSGTPCDGEEPPSGSPDLLNLVPEESGCRGGQGPSELLGSGSSEATLRGGASCGDDSASGRSTTAEQSGESWLREAQPWRETEGEAGRAWRAERRRSPESTAAASAPPGQTRDSSHSQRAPSFSEDTFFPERLPPSTPHGSEVGTPEVGLWPRGNSRSLEDGPGEASSADVCRGGSGREEERLPTTMGATQPTEGSKLGQGQGVEQEGEAALEAREQGGAGGGRAEAPPPKPPRRFTPLSLEEEVNQALWGSQEGWPGGAAERGTPEGPVVDTLPRGPAVEEAAPASAVAAASLALTAIIGAGGGSIQRATEDLRLAAEDDEPAEANEPMSRAFPSGDTMLVASGGTGGAEQFETCPSKLSSSGLGLPSAKESSGQPRGDEPSPVLWPTETAGPRGLPEPGSLRAAQEFPGGLAAGAWPCATPREPPPSPPALFWTALEEPPLQLSQDCPGQLPPEGGGLGEEGPPEPGAGGAGPAGSPVGRAPPATSPCPRVLAGGMLRHEQSSAGEPELSSSWSDDRVVDCKKADFWEAEGGALSSKQGAAMTPGNPFAPRPAPPLQNNPFVETPPDVLPGQAAVLQVSPVEGPGSRERHAEAALPGPLPAPPFERPPVAPFLHGSQPLAASTPSLQAVVCPKAFTFPSPVVPPATGGAPAGSSHAVAQPSCALSRPSTDAAAPAVLPVESQLAEEVPVQRIASPHPVKPISSSSSTPGPEISSEEKPQQAASRTPDQRSGQEKLKPSTTSSHDSASLTLQLGKTEPKRDPSVLDHSAKYYHLTHDELIQLLLKREAELSKKQEHVQELENYIDRLLVRIMERSPTLLQIPLGGEPKAAK